MRSRLNDRACVDSYYYLAKGQSAPTELGVAFQGKRWIELKLARACLTPLPPQAFGKGSTVVACILRCRSTRKQAV